MVKISTHRSVWAAAFVLLAAGVVLAAWLVRPADPEPMLAEARVLLSTMADANDQAKRWEQVQQAHALLEQYLDAGGAETTTAELLLAAVTGLVSHQETTQPAPEAMLARLDLAGVSTADLATAAFIFFGAGQFGQADRLITEALERTDERERVLRLAALIHYDLGRDPDVLEHCRELARLDPLDPRPWQVMAQVYENTSQWEDLIEALLKVIELDPQNAAAFRPKVIEFAIQVGRQTLAREQFERLREVSGEGLVVSGEKGAHDSPLTTYHSILLLEAKLLYSEGQTGPAEAILGRVLQEQPNNPEALMMRGRLLAARAQWDEQVKVLQRLVAIDPTHNEAHYQLGQAYARLNQTAKAEHHLRLHRKLLDTKVKLHQLERHASRNPTDVAVRREISMLYQEIDNPALAEFWRRAAESAEVLRQELPNLKQSPAVRPAPAYSDF